MSKQMVKTSATGKAPAAKGMIWASQVAPDHENGLKLRVYGAKGEKVSTLDLAGHGRFSLFTGIGGQGWRDAARLVGKELGLDIAVTSIGPRQDWEDYAGDWANARQMRDSGAVLVRPDQHVAWRSDAIVTDPTGELRRVLKSVLAR